MNSSTHSPDHNADTADPAMQHLINCFTVLTAPIALPSPDAVLRSESGARRHSPAI